VVDSFGTYEYIVDKAGDHLKEIVSMGKTQEKIEIEALEKDPDNAPKMADKMKELLQTMDPASAMIEFNKLALTGVFGKAAEQAALKIESLPISPETKKEIEKIGTQEIATAEIINLTRHKVESGPNTEEKSSKAWWKERTAIIEKARREQKHEIQKLMKLWKRNGVIINFTPHKN
jgi:hypothetical protein